MQSDTVQAAKSVETNETSRLISSEKVDGTAVYNGVGLHLGAIHHLMIDKFSGHVEYAGMSFEWRDRQCDLIVAWWIGDEQMSSAAQKRKVGKVMHEYKKGDLKSRKVKSRQQAVAIAMSESGQSKKRKKAS